MRAAIHPLELSELPRDPAAAMRHLASFGLQAPSSHNTQPWLFRVGDERIEIHGNRARALPQSDPSSREFFVSLGCALENILVAADYYGIPRRVEYFPDDSDPDFVARISFSSFSGTRAPSNSDHLAFQIARRHANREPFAARAIPEEARAELLSLAQGYCRTDFITDPARRARIAAIVGDATTFAFNDKGFTAELSRWMRPSFPRYKDGMPGYNLGIPFPVSFLVPFAIRYGNVAASQRKMTDAMLAASSAFLVISAADGPAHWVDAGRLLERIWLTASRQGINMGILAAAVEMDGYPAALAEAAGTPLRPQVFARLGYASAAPPPSPRLDIDDALLP